MSTFVALLRAVNVSGTKLPMQDLKALCVKAGFTKVQTYIASGNVLFTSAKSEKAVKAALEKALQGCFGKPVGVMVRTDAQMKQVLEDNPFPNAEGNRTVAIFLDASPPGDALSAVTRAAAGDRLALGKREIYVYYRDGIGESKMKIPAASTGTARNMNTIAKLAGLAAKL